MSKRSRFWIGPASALVLLVMATSSLASDTDQVDPADTEGRFDVIEVALSHDADNGLWRTKMARNWTLRQAWDAGYVLIYFDTKADEDADFYVLIRSTGRGLRAALYKDKATGKDPLLGPVDARRPDSKTAQAEFKLSRLEIAESRTEWFWSIQTLWTSSLCSHVCMDLVPDSGSVAQPVEEVVSSLGSTREAPIEATPNPEDVDLPL